MSTAVVSMMDARRQDANARKAMPSTDLIAEEIIATQGRLASDRANFESYWNEVADYVRPDQATFLGDKSPGVKTGDRIFDATAPLALNYFAASMDGYITPRTQKWHGLAAADPEVAALPHVRAYLEGLRDLLFQMRYQPRANFATQINECYMALGAYGTCALFTDTVPGIAQGLPQIRYRALHLAEIYVDEDFSGVVDRVHRRFKLTARQAVQQFGEDALPEEIVKAAEKNLTTEFEFIHCVKPNRERLAGRVGPAGMPFSSYYVSVTGKKVVEMGGYRTFPYSICRYMTAPREKYGRSPAMTVLPEIKTVNEMAKTLLRAGHKVVDPPLLMPDDGVLEGFSTRPNALNVGGVDSQGRQLVVPLQTGARLDYGQEMLAARQKTIQDAFMVTLFQILVQTPEMTATEAMLRAQEKGQLLAPSMGRVQSELLGPTVERELDILASSGLIEAVLGPMPDELFDTGGEYAVVYESPLTKAMQAEEGVAILRTIESLNLLAQYDQNVLKKINVSRTADKLAQINGAFVGMMNTDAELQAMQEQEAAMAEAQQLIEAAPAAASAAKDLASAQAIAMQSRRAPIPGT